MLDEQGKQAISGKSMKMGNVQPGNESGDADAILNAFNKDTNRVLEDWIVDREV